METYQKPDYGKIFQDILKKKFPNKLNDFKFLLKKKDFSALDVIQLNNKIFGVINKENDSFNQKSRSYSQSDILYILNYQKEYSFSNTQVANHFKLSRNTVSKWKKIFNI